MGETTEEDWDKARTVRDAWVGDNTEVLTLTRNGPLAQHIAQAIADERERTLRFAATVSPADLMQALTEIDATPQQEGLDHGQ